MTTEAQKKARNKYNQANNINKTISFNRKTETDLIEWIADKQFSSYIKDLIRKDMKEQQESRM